ncbi:MAG: DUF1573 domain-containing protein [Planctomycetota bacterium]|nr:DUF1573 domain-containing protein [Planctomycetota bacterium]
MQDCNRQDCNRRDCIRPYRVLFLGLILALPLLLVPNSPSLGGDDDLGPPPPPITQGPKIRFDQNSFDWGEVLQGAKVEHTYHFRNVGDSVLRITQVKPG